jgi:hypothetical protein
VVYSCCWASPAQSFSRQSPAVFMTVFYCPNFETPPTWWARFLYLFPLGTGWPSNPLGHWVPFSTFLTSRRVTLISLFLTESKSKLCYDRRSVGQSVFLSGYHLGPPTHFSFTSLLIIFRIFLFSYDWAPSLTRGRVCNLHVCLPLGIHY